MYSRIARRRSSLSPAAWVSTVPQSTSTVSQNTSLAQSPDRDQAPQVSEVTSGGTTGEIRAQLQAERHRAERLGHHFGRIPVLGPQSEASSGVRSIQPQIQMQAMEEGPLPNLVESEQLPVPTGSESDELQFGDPLYGDQSGDALLGLIASAYAPQQNMGYNEARDLMYGQIDNQDGQVEGKYTGYRTSVPVGDPKARKIAYEGGINAEHVYPQSKGARSVKGDLHNLFPTKVDVNSTRSSHPFGEIDDNQTSRWFRGDGSRSTTPGPETIDQYSEFRSGRFEPREAVKGDIARAMFYFRTIHGDRADLDFFEQQKEVLLQWHQQDPATQAELERSLKIAESKQGNHNPFVLDPTLALRMFFPEAAEDLLNPDSPTPDTGSPDSETPTETDQTDAETDPGPTPTDPQGSQNDKDDKPDGPGLQAPAVVTTEMGEPAQISGISVTGQPREIMTAIFRTTKGALEPISKLPEDVLSEMNGGELTLMGHLHQVPLGIEFQPEAEDFKGSVAIEATVEGEDGAVVDRQTLLVGVGVPADQVNSIAAIQGASHRSGLEGAKVQDVSGVVTLVQKDGFFMQMAEGDGDVRTSDGIFVYTQEPPTVVEGNGVEVDGRVTEFQSFGNKFNPREFNLTNTQIDARERNQGSVTVTGTGQSAERVSIGKDRLPPGQITDDDQFQQFDPESDAIDFYESLEGMQVGLEDARAVSTRGYEREIYGVSDKYADQYASGYNRERGVLVIGESEDPQNRQVDSLQDDDLSPERIPIVGTNGARLPTKVQAGDHLGDVNGVMDYAQNRYMLRTPNSITATPGAPEKTVTDLTSDQPNQLTVAGMNMENLDPSDVDNKGEDRFQRLAEVIVKNMGSPDVIGMQEVQDNDGSEDTAETSASESARLLIQAIETAGGPEYLYFDMPPQDDTDGGQPGANIRSAFLYNPEIVEINLDSPHTGRILDSDSLEAQDPTARTAGRVIDGSGQAVDRDRDGDPEQTDRRLSYEDEDDRDAFEGSRKPLAATFIHKQTGQEVNITNVHWSSRRGSDPQFGSKQPAYVNEEKRARQAAITNAHVDSYLADNPEGAAIVLGDFNTFGFTSSINQVEGGDGQTPLAKDDPNRVLWNLDEQLAPEQRYSYIYQGAAQTLDHVLVNQQIRDNWSPEIEKVHVNAGYADQASDHDPVVTRYTLPQRRKDR